jgi:DNA-binding XRE family transcriptional regulator
VSKIVNGKTRPHKQPAAPKTVPQYKQLGLHRNRGYVYVPVSIHQKAKKLWATSKYSQVQIGRRLGINNSTVSKIVRGLTQPHF